MLGIQPTLKQMGADIGETSTSQQRFADIVNEGAILVKIVLGDQKTSGVKGSPMCSWGLRDSDS